MKSENRDTLLIKNMVCPRCITAVRQILTELGLTVHDVSLGRAEVAGDAATAEPAKIDAALRAHGFELLQDRERQIVERIKNELLNYLYTLEKAENPDIPSAYLSKKLGFSYDHLSKLFSQYEHTTIEKYLIHLKIERVKELLSYDEFTLSEIAYRLHYSSPQHLSRQFKQITGMTVSEFKQQPFVHRHSLDQLPE
jgi:AraC-like DNA-binding protein